MGARALTETANPLIWSPTKTRLNPATVSRVIPMHVAKARFEPKPVDAADRTFRRNGGVASTDRRNTLRKLLCWGLVLQGLAGAFVQLPGNCA
jgi:hypothetical protein